MRSRAARYATIFLGIGCITIASDATATRPDWTMPPAAFLHERHGQRTARSSRKTLAQRDRQAMGARLRSARQARHWTLAEAAARFGFPPSTLGEYEQGRSDIPIAVLQRAPEVYGQAGDPQVILFGRQPVRHACEFLDFTLMVAEDNSLRRVVLALAQDDTRRREAERILTDATRVKKLREPPGPE